MSVRNGLHGCRCQRGIALILVLWTLVLLTVIAGSLTIAARTELAMTRNLLDEVQGRAVLEAGFTYVLANYLGGNRPEVEEELPADGRLREWVFDGHTMSIGLRGEDAKIDLNLADEALIKGALHSVGLDDEVAEAIGDAILDWRDVDDLHRLVGAEDSEYAREGYPYGAKDGRFESVAELGLVFGVNKTIYDLIYPLFTVHSGTKTINPRYAERAVLLAIPGVSKDQVDEFIQARDGEGAADFQTVFPSGDTRFSASTDSGVYRIFSEVELSGGLKLRGEMTVELRPRGRKRYRILQVSYNVPVSNMVGKQVQDN